MTRAILVGAGIVLASSVWPLRALNALCCLGVVLGGFVAGVLYGRADQSMLESTRGMQMGGMAGFVGALAAIVITTVAGWLSSDGIVLDPIPDVVYRFVYPLWSGLLDIPLRGGSETPGQPGTLWRLLFQIPSNVLFGSFGGAVAASMFRRQPPLRRS